MLDDPSTGVSTFEYDAWDQLRVTTNAAGDSTTFTRDALGRLTSREETYADGARRTARWQWDTAISGAGRAVLGMLDSSAVDGAVPIIERIEYDELARPSGMTRELNGLPLTMTIARDGEGRVTSLTYPTAISDTPYAVAFDYEPRSGQLVRVHRGEHALWDLRAENARGEPTVEPLGPIGRVTSYTPGGRMETLRSGMAGPEPVALQELTYEYASRGLLTGRTNALTGRHESMEHDSLGRLISLTTTDASSSRTQGFKIDGLGNLRAAGEEQIRFDDASHPQLATMYQQGGSALWEELAYDEAGRVVTATTGAGARQYTWNADDLPRHVEDPSVGAVDFSYTADGERAAKVGPGGDLTGYVAGLYEVSRRGMDVVERYYVPTPAGVVASVERRSGEGGVSDTERWLLTDYQGSVETTWVRGQAPEHVLYDPFGGVVDAGGVVEDRTPTPDATHGYTGHEHDGELGLVNMGGRIYDPRIRRFLTGDPLLAPGTQGLNRYAYVHNRPFDATDPSGWQARARDPEDRAGTPRHPIPLGPFVITGAPPAPVTPAEVSSGAGADGDGGGGSDSSTGEQVASAATGSDPGTTSSSSAGLASPTPGQERFRSTMATLGANLSFGIAPLVQQLREDPEGTSSALASSTMSAVLEAMVETALHGDPSPLGFVATLGRQHAEAQATHLGQTAATAVSAPDPIARASAQGELIGTALSTAVFLAIPGPRATLGRASSPRALVAADVGLAPNTALRALEGTITDAGTTRIISVGYIEAGEISPLPQLRSALPRIVSAARADGMATLQIETSFANPGLERFAASATEALGGVYSSVGGRDLMTFILRGGPR